MPRFHLVVAPPHDLNGLIRIARRVIYARPFGAVPATLAEFAADPRWPSGTPAFSLVRHTCKQDPGRHVPVHALVAGGALAPSGEWKSSKRGFLFPVKAPSKMFRGKFVAALKAARENGTPGGATVPDAATWHALLARLFAHERVVYAKQPLGGPALVLEYPGRCGHRVAISDERIVGVDDREVRFRVCDSAREKRTLALPAATFIDRFRRHVLAKGFKHIRHYGLLGAP